MALTFDTQSFFNSVWGEEITYGRVGTVSSTVLTACRYQRGRSEGRRSNGVYTILTEQYTLATDALAFEPKVRDTITPTLAPAAALGRVITKVEATNFLKFWLIDCQYPALAADLDQTATVYRPAPAPDAIGLRVANLATVYTDHAVRLQPTERSFEEDIAGKFVTRAIYECVFAAAVVLNAGDVVEVSGVRYEVRGQSEIESLGLLTFADCTRIQ